MIRKMMAVMALSILALLLGLRNAPSQAEGNQQQQAIDLVAAHPVFTEYLATQGNWKAAAYFTNNPFDVWRVQFWTEGGEELAWADVNLDRGKVYSWEIEYAFSDQKRKEGEAVVVDFVRGLDEVNDLMGVTDYEFYIEYRGWNDTWSAYIYKDGLDLEVRLRFDSPSPMTFENPRLIGIFFPNVMSFTEWYKGQQDQAVSIAFINVEVAAILKDKAGWVSTAERNEDGTWSVVFKQGETQLVSAVVNIDTREVLSVGE
jgi:hypothetical protein